MELKVYKDGVASDDVIFVSMFERIDKCGNTFLRWTDEYTKVYPNVSGLAAWSEKCKWYSSLPLGVVVSILCGSI
jgi:hypothetical protein